MIKIVIGLGFGDEGKGAMVSTLVTKSSVVVRYSGGQQCGHTVIYNGQRHVFSNFGSGTLQGIPTFWSKYCTLNPVGVVNEYKALKKFDPVLMVDPLAMVTTPYDIESNRFSEKIDKHGSCGMGVGSTMKRNLSPYKLYVQDLFYENVLREKLKAISEYYSYINNNIMDEKINRFCQYSSIARKIIKLKSQDVLSDYDNIVFEGSQGILLDMDFGFFPNVTYANTTSKNALCICKDIGRKDIEIYYVTRAYQTRHGSGYMTNDPIELINNLDETNVTNEWQGKFRATMLDVDLLKYALQCDSNYSHGMDSKLIVTCLDQMINYNFTSNGDTLIAWNEKDFINKLNVELNSINAFPKILNRTNQVLQ